MLHYGIHLQFLLTFFLSPARSSVQRYLYRSHNRSFAGFPLSLSSLNLIEAMTKHTETNINAQRHSHKNENVDKKKTVAARSISINILSPDTLQYWSRYVYNCWPKSFESSINKVYRIRSLCAIDCKKWIRSWYSYPVLRRNCLMCLFLFSIITEIISHDLSAYA